MSHPPTEAEIEEYNERATVPLLERARKRVAEAEAKRQAADAAERERCEANNLRHLFKLVRDTLDEDAERFTLGRVTVEQPGGDEPWVGEYPCVTIDGLCFTLAISYATTLGLVLPCPKCETQLSHRIDSLSDIAQVHDGPRSHYRCRAHLGKTVPSPLPIEPTVEQRLLSALSDYIRQESST